MIAINIPKSSPKGKLKVLINIGKQGFSRCETYKKDEWKSGQTIYVDPDTVSVVFSNGGWSETVNLKPF